MSPLEYVQMKCLRYRLSVLVYFAKVMFRQQVNSRIV